MNNFTITHLRAWIERAYNKGERYKVLLMINDFVSKHPHLLERHSWPEIRNLAEREKEEFIISKQGKINEIHRPL